jgi:hypothetical protein
MTEIIELAQNLFDAATASGQKYNSTLALQLGNIGNREICRRAYCSRTNDTLTTVSGTREYAYPTDFLSMQRVEYQDTAGNVYRLGTINPNDIYDATGIPSGYYLLDSVMGFDLKPNDAYTINRYYFRGPSADLMADQSPSLIPSQFHYVLADFIVYQFFKIDKSDVTGGLQKWMGFYEKDLKDMRDYLREGMNQDSFIPVKAG